MLLSKVWKGQRERPLSPPDMPDSPMTLIPPDAVKLFLVVFLSFLIGLEREERKLSAEHYSFGGVRTYPLLGLMGYALAYLSTGELIPLAAGFVVVGLLLLVAYWHKVQTSQESGFTSEVAGLMTYLIGALVYGEHFGVATAIAIISLILLELKSTLEGLTERFSAADILTFTQFLFLTLVVLPILPNRTFGPFDINPFTTWLVVVTVSAISYGSYLLQRTMRGRGGVLLAALLGGAYSSTVTTVALAKRSTRDRRPSVYAGGILMASGMMYLRLALLVMLFNPALRSGLGPPLIVFGIVGVGSGMLWARRSHVPPPSSAQNRLVLDQNPLELKAAALFAALFVLMVIVTHYVIDNLGDRGVYLLAAIVGGTDADPFILGMTQSAGLSTPLLVAGRAILLAAASNNAVKGLYGLIFGDREAGRQSLVLLIALAALGLTPLLWLR